LFFAKDCEEEKEKMLDDPDIIYDFDDLFDPGVFDEGNACF
jgi:hypothetical protein